MLSSRLTLRTINFFPEQQICYNLTYVNKPYILTHLYLVCIIVEVLVPKETLRKILGTPTIVYTNWTLGAAAETHASEKMMSETYEFGKIMLMHQMK